MPALSKRARWLMTRLVRLFVAPVALTIGMIVVGAAGCGGRSAFDERGYSLPDGGSNGGDGPTNDASVSDSSVPSDAKLDTGALDVTPPDAVSDAASRDGPACS